MSHSHGHTHHPGYPILHLHAPHIGWHSVEHPLRVTLIVASAMVGLALLGLAGKCGSRAPDGLRRDRPARRQQGGEGRQHGQLPPRDSQQGQADQCARDDQGHAQRMLDRVPPDVRRVQVQDRIARVVRVSM